MADEPATILHLEIPLRDPFATASGTVLSRSVCLVRLRDGPFGWGEAAPYPGQDESIADLLRSARGGSTTPTLGAAMDEARADRLARIKGVSLSETIGATMSNVPVSLAVGLGDPIRAVDQGYELGVSRFKVKIAPGRLEHVSAIRERFPDVVIGLDANGSFDRATASELISLRDLDVEFVEQPVADMALGGAAGIAEHLDAPVFADESVRSVADAHRLLSLESVDGVVVKPGRLGWTGALAVRDLANEFGKLWRASGLLETGIGRAYTDILAACPDAFVSDVAPADWFLEADITGSRYTDGQITVPTAPGVGVDPNPDTVDRYLIERIELT